MPTRDPYPNRCPDCGASLLRDAALCPVCGADPTQPRLSEQCPSCGARLAPGQENCPICGARRALRAPRRVNAIGLALGLLALVALVAAIVLLQQRPEVVTAVLPIASTTPSVTPTARASVTPTATATATATLSATAPNTPTSTATVTPTPTATPPYELYVVASGDSVFSIARAHDISEDELRQINELSATAQVVVGQELVVPILPQTPTPTPSASPTAGKGRVVHVVQQGESLLRIAALYDVTVEQILRENNLTANDILSIGQELVIEDASAPAATSTPTPLLNTPTPTEALPITHTIKAGEHLGVLAVLYDVSAAEIARANGITTDTILSIGQELIIPRTVATPDYSPTPTQVPSETPTPTPTHTPTPLPTATVDMPPSPTPQPLLGYPQPLLLAPPSGAAYGPEDSPLLNWTSVGILDEDEWYLVRIWHGPQYTRVHTLLTQSTSALLPAELYPGEQGWPEFMSQVIVVRQRLGGQRYDSLSPASALRRFTWR